MQAISLFFLFCMAGVGFVVLLVGRAMCLSFSGRENAYSVVFFRISALIICFSLFLVAIISIATPSEDVVVLLVGGAICFSFSGRENAYGVVFCRISALIICFSLFLVAIISIATPSEDMNFLQIAKEQEALLLTMGHIIFVIGIIIFLVGCLCTWFFSADAGSCGFGLVIAFFGAVTMVITFLIFVYSMFFCVDNVDHQPPLAPQSDSATYETTEPAISEEQTTTIVPEEPPCKVIGGQPQQPSKIGDTLYAFSEASKAVEPYTVTSITWRDDNSVRLNCS